MSNVFNSVFEVSLRVLLLLSEKPECWYTIDMVTAVDFIAVYGKNFGVSEENLHGDNGYSFCEHAVRRELVQKAMKSLVLKGLVNASFFADGFSYSINEKGLEYVAKLNSSYADEYRQQIKLTLASVGTKSQREMLQLINQYSVGSVQRREHHE